MYATQSVKLSRLGKRRLTSKAETQRNVRCATAIILAAVAVVTAMVLGSMNLGPHVQFINMGGLAGHIRGPAVNRDWDAGHRSRRRPVGAWATFPHRDSAELAATQAGASAGGCGPLGRQRALPERIGASRLKPQMVQ